MLKIFLNGCGGYNKKMKEFPEFLTLPVNLLKIARDVYSLHKKLSNAGDLFILNENLFSALLKGEASRLHFNFESRLIKMKLEKI